MSRDDWLKQALQRCLDAGVCRESTQAEWDEALAPVVARVLQRQEENTLAALMEMASLTGQANPPMMEGR